MLKWLVAAMGVLVMIAGGYTAAQGWSIVQVERGWAQVIAGSALLASGFVVLALAGVMARIDALSRSLNAVRPVRPVAARAEAPGRETPADSPPPAEPDPLPLPLEASMPPPRASVEGPSTPEKPPEFDSLPPIPAFPDIKVEEPPPRSAEKFTRPIPPLPPLKSRIPRPAPRLPVDLPPEPVPDHRPPPRVSEFRSGEWPDFPQALVPTRPHLAELAPEEDAPPEFAPPPPLLVRRYESGGVSYQLFSDGSIEAQTESGMYKFSSLEELRAFIESKKL